MSLSLFRKGLLVVAVAGLLASVGAYAGTRGGSGAHEKAPPQQQPAPAPSQPAGPVSIASGSAQRSFVSANHGNDANPCTVTLPCRNFAAAIAQTAAGGEVIVLDSGGYGPVTIGSSISLISPPGVYAGITAFSGDAITITAGASDVVTLRGLTLNGLGGDRGVDFQAGGALYVEQLTIKNFASFGIYVFPSGSALVRVEDTTVTRSGNVGIFLGTSTGGVTVKATIVDSRFEDDVNGVIADNQSQVAVQNSVATGNTGVGFYASAGDLSLDGCVSSHNNYGLYSSGTVRSSSTLIVKNNVGVFGNVISWGNNRLAGNTTDGSFSSTIGLQ